MSQIAPQQEWWTPEEIAARALPDLPATKRRVNSVAERLGCRSQVVTELAWLAENGFVETVDRGDFVIATATDRGLEIAQGLVTHPDIQRPNARRGG